jgi:hypothetical protein
MQTTESGFTPFLIFKTKDMIFAIPELTYEPIK